MDVLRLLAGFLRPDQVVKLARLNRRLTRNICADVRKSDPWCIRWEAFLHAMWAHDGHKWNVRLVVPRVISRTCRGCGKYTERKVFKVPLCEKCTRDTTKKWHMVSVASLGAKWKPGRAPTHSGRRGLLVFKPHLIN